MDAIYRLFGYTPSSQSKLHSNNNNNIKNNDNIGCIEISGFIECMWFRRAVCIANDFASLHPNKLAINIKTVNRSNWYNHLTSMHNQVNEDNAKNHRTCPIVLKADCNTDQIKQSVANADNNSSNDIILRPPFPTINVVKCDNFNSCTNHSLIGGFTELEKYLFNNFNFQSQRCGIKPRTGLTTCT